MEKESMFFSNDEYLNQNWDNSMDQNDPFESALSSMVSSPTTSNCNKNGENFVLRELIGRLGGICNSGEISPQIVNINHNPNTSCYSTPLNSPPKLNLGVMDPSGNFHQTPGGSFPNLVPFATDPGFVERAARFSCFANKGLVGQLGLSEMGKISRVGSSQSIKVVGSQENRGGAFLEDNNNNNNLTCEKSDFVDCTKEMSEVSEQIPIGLSSRKRKSVQRGKGKENPAPALPKDNTNAVSENCESNAKRSKSEDGSGNEKSGGKDANEKGSKENSKAAEPPKDYIHVRARRGQATDAHSLAERVRREKIGERMKLLQDLVPGCNKVTGKAVMLDEIINYVQSLQRQVEFLSMKLATVNPRMDVNMEALMSKDMFQSRGPMPPNSYPSSDCYPYQSQQNLHAAMNNGSDASFITAALGRSQGMQLPPMDNFSETASQVSTFWENDLHNVVQMGYGQNQTQNFHGILPTSQMKTEL